MISSHTFALAHQLLRECVGVKAISDEEFIRIKTNALNYLPDDQQTMLKDITPSKIAADYPQEVRDVAQTILDLHNRKVRKDHEETRTDERKSLLSSQDSAL